MSTTSQEQLLATHQEELLRFIFRKVNCPDATQDIFQDTYIRYATYPKKDQIDNHRAFLFRIASNLATDYQRHNSVRDKFISVGDEGLETIAQQESLQPDKIVATHERLECLAQAVETLPPKCRDVFILRKIQGLSHAQIATQLGISHSMVERHLRHALEILQQLDHD